MGARPSFAATPLQLRGPVLRYDIANRLCYRLASDAARERDVWRSNLSSVDRSGAKATTTSGRRGPPVFGANSEDPARDAAILTTGRSSRAREPGAEAAQNAPSPRSQEAPICR